MKKFFKATDSWINKFGCTGLLIEFLKKEPEVICQEYGTEVHILTKPITIDPYFPDNENGRVFKITVFAPTCDSVNVIDLIPLITRGVNWKRHGATAEVMSEDEENWLVGCIWKTFEERD